jgi:hypothetical protein
MQTPTTSITGCHWPHLAGPPVLTCSGMRPRAPAATLLRACRCVDTVVALLIPQAQLCDRTRGQCGGGIEGGGGQRGKRKRVGARIKLNVEAT